MSFENLGLAADLLRGVVALGYQQPTPVQSSTIPAALSGRDVLACAMTGSGKTAAFVLPILQRLASRPRGATRALVLAPTRELAAQVEEQFRLLGAHSRVKSAAIFGGVGMAPQEQAFRRGVDVLVATPGRLLDHLQHSYASLDAVEILVLDEADRMLDMGFLPDVKRVLQRVPPAARRQTLFFSATMPPPIVELSRAMLTDPVRVDVERRAAPATGITQALFPVREEAKPALLLALLERGIMQQALVFTRTKHRANRLAELLVGKGLNVARIHGNRSQAQRTDALDGFKSGRYRVLVATDIAARGIDVEALEHVLNFDVPNVPEDYIHRVGRTGRAQATGEAYTFVSPEEEGDVRAIERAIGRRLPRETLADFDYSQRPAERFEVPIGERIAEIRRRKAEERQRAREKAERRTQREASATGSARPAQPVRNAREGARATAVPDTASHRGAARVRVTPGEAGGSSTRTKRRRRRGGRGGGGGGGGGAQRGQTPQPYSD